MIPYIDLAEGPWDIAMPEGEVRGVANRLWQVGVTQMTEPGKCLFVGPDQAVTEDAEREDAWQSSW